MAYVLWGTPQGQTDALYEQPLTTRETARDCEIIQKIAAKDGWHSFRIVPLGAPVFGAASLSR